MRSAARRGQRFCRRWTCRPRPDRTSDGGLGSDSYGYDAGGRLSGYTHAFSGDASKNLVAGLSYNPANQVRTRTVSNSLYDEAPGANVTNTYTLNGLNQITGTGSSSLSYNARGSLRNDGSNSYGYSIYNQLTSVSGSASASLVYDGGRQLVQTQGSSTTLLAYDGAMIAEEQNTSDTVLRRYAPGPDGTPLVWYEGAGNADRRWLFKDQIGTVQAVMNGSGASDGINTYDAYGVPASSNLGRFQFAGRPWIPEAGLYDNAARSYSPTLGRFLQTDPIGYGDGMNDYAYAHLDPVNGSDPSGLQAPTGSHIDDGNGDGQGPSGAATNLGIYGNQTGSYVYEGFIKNIPGGPGYTNMDTGEQFDGGPGFYYQFIPAFGSGIGSLQFTSGSAAGPQGLQQISLSLSKPLRLSSCYGAPGFDAFQDAANNAFSDNPYAPIDSVFPFSVIRGTSIHAQFASEINALGGPYSAEVSYRGGFVVPYGTAGSVRADGVYGPVASPLYAVELKSGMAVPSAGEIDNYYANLPSGTRLCGIAETGG